MKKYNLVKSSGSSIVPAGVKVISVVYILGAVLFAFMGIVMMSGSSAAGPVLAAFAPNAPQDAGLGIFVIAAAVFGFLVGFSLWKGMKWARITALVLNGLGFVLVTVGLFTNASLGMLFAVKGVMWMIVNGLIVWYLGFNKRAVAAFK